MCEGFIRAFVRVEDLACRVYDLGFEVYVGFMVQHESCREFSNRLLDRWFRFLSKGPAALGFRASRRRVQWFRDEDGLGPRI